MTPLPLLTSHKRRSSKLTTNSKIFKSVIKAIREKKGENILSLDLRKIPEAVTDFFIICQAASTTQIKAIADFVEEKVKKECGEIRYRHEGYRTLHWVLIDYINIVVHIMLPQVREFYKLEEMWSDGHLLQHND